jgi:hypothetical protein
VQMERVVQVEVEVEVEVEWVVVEWAVVVVVD